MRRIGKRGIVLTLAAIVSAASITGCGTQLPSDVIASYGDQMIGREEAEFYARYQQYSTEYMYAMYGSSLTGIWDQVDQTTSKTYEEEAKENALTAVLQTEILNEKAVADGITLTEEEQQKVDEAVTEIMQAEPIVEACGLTEETAKSIVTKNAMANKEYQAMVADIDTNVDESEVLHKTMEQISIREKQEDSTEASTETVTEEEQQQVDTAAAELGETIKSALEQGATLDQIVEQYNEKEFNGVTFTVAKRDAFALGKEDSDIYTEQAMEMTQGQVITASGDGVVYVVRCTSEKDEEGTNEAIEQELANRRTAMFEEKYAELKKSAKKFTVNEREWEKVIFSEPLIEVSTEDTSSSESSPSEGETSTSSEAETTQATDTAAEDTTAAQAATE